MARRVYEYRLSGMPFEEVFLSRSAKFLDIGEIDKRIVLWYEIDTANIEMDCFNYYILMTSDIIPDNSEYIGTVQMSFHDLVAHVYREKK